MSKKFILISPKNRTVYNFRGDLLREIKKLGYELIVTGPNEDHIDKINELGAKFIKIPLNKSGINLISDLIYLLKLKKIFKDEKPDAILAYTIKPVIYGGFAAKMAKVKNISLMVTGAGYLFSAKTIKAKIMKQLACFLYRISFKTANRVIFQNPDDMEEFTALNLLAKDKCRIVNGSGVNMDWFKPQEYPQNLTFFMLSRILYSKGIREYLSATEKLKNKYPAVRNILLGALEDIPDSMSRENLQEYIDKGSIDYFGETDDVRTYYAMASVFVLPSYREGTPRTVLEAMSMGRAIITTETPGCKETVVNGQNGFLIQVNNSSELFEKMEEFVLHPELVEKMGKASIEYCKKKFDVKIVNTSMIEIMQL